jgi:hypothetical protein
MNRLCLSLLCGAALVSGCGPNSPATPPAGPAGNPPGTDRMIQGQGAAGQAPSALPPPGPYSPGRPPGMPPGATLPGGR